MAGLDSFLQNIHLLTSQEKEKLLEILIKLRQQSAPHSDQVASLPASNFGWAKDYVKIGPDFDEPLPEFEDYRG